MAPRFSGQNSIFGGVFFVSKSLLGIKEQNELKKKTGNFVMKASALCKSIKMSNVASINSLLSVSVEMRSNTVQLSCLIYYLPDYQ